MMPSISWLSMCFRGAGATATFAEGSPVHPPTGPASRGPPDRVQGVTEKGLVRALPTGALKQAASGCPAPQVSRPPALPSARRQSWAPASTLRACAAPVARHAPQTGQVIAPGQAQVARKTSSGPHLCCASPRHLQNCTAAALSKEGQGVKSKPSTVRN